MASNYKSLNEGFSSLFNNITPLYEGYFNYEEDEEIKNEEESLEEELDSNALRVALTQAVDDLMDQRVTNIKAYEVALQDAIEATCSEDKPWWEITNCNIFMDLFENRDPYGTIECIINNLKNCEDEDLEIPLDSSSRNKKILKEEDIEDADFNGDTVIDFENESSSCIEEKADAVMAAYQNANKWLDSVKESIYRNMNCPFFSSFVHKLAHTMPERFDKFGDILHTCNIEIPYPQTMALENKPSSLVDAFEIIFSTLDNIKDALNDFIKCADEDNHGMACAAEVCLNDIEKEYPMLYRLKAKAEECGDDTISFDKFVGQYNEHKDDLLESCNFTKRVQEGKKSNLSRMKKYLKDDLDQDKSKSWVDRDRDMKKYLCADDLDQDKSKSWCDNTKQGMDKYLKDDLDQDKSKSFKESSNYARMKKYLIDDLDEDNALTNESYEYDDFGEYDIDEFEKGANAPREKRVITPEEQAQLDSYINEYRKKHNLPLLNRDNSSNDNASADYDISNTSYSQVEEESLKESSNYARMKKYLIDDLDEDKVCPDCGKKVCECNKEEF